MKFGYVLFLGGVPVGSPTSTGDFVCVSPKKKATWDEYSILSSSVVVLLVQLQGSAVRIPKNRRPARASYDVKSFSKRLVFYSPNL